MSRLAPVRSGSGAMSNSSQRMPSPGTHSRYGGLPSEGVARKKELSPATWVWRIMRCEASTPHAMRLLSGTGMFTSSSRTGASPVLLRPSV